MRLVKFSLRWLGIGLLLGLISTLTTVASDWVAKDTTERASLWSMFLLSIRNFRRKRRKLPTPGQMIRELQRGHGFHSIRRSNREVFRKGWRQVYLPKDTESDTEHVLDCNGISLELAAELGFDLEQTRYLTHLGEVHELVEGFDESDKPLISHAEMPRSREGRIDYMLHSWPAPDREAEKARLREEYETHQEEIAEWIANQPEGEQDFWRELVDDFYSQKTQASQVFFEVHAYQGARKAYMLLEDHKDQPKRFPPRAVIAWIKRAERLVTIPNLAVRINFLKELLSEKLDDEHRELLNNSS